MFAITNLTAHPVQSPNGSRYGDTALSERFSEVCAIEKDY